MHILMFRECHYQKRPIVLCSAWQIKSVIMLKTLLFAGVEWDDGFANSADPLLFLLISKGRCPRLR